MKQFTREERQGMYNTLAARRYFGMHERDLHDAIDNFESIDSYFNDINYYLVYSLNTVKTIDPDAIPILLERALIAVLTIDDPKNYEKCKDQISKVLVKILDTMSEEQRNSALEFYQMKGALCNKIISEQARDLMVIASKQFQAPSEEKATLSASPAAAISQLRIRTTASVPAAAAQPAHITVDPQAQQQIEKTQQEPAVARIKQKSVCERMGCAIL